MLDIHHVLSALATKRPIFHSEADLQHEMAWIIRELYPSAQIRLEIPSGNDVANERIDLVVQLNSLKIAIELKYKKAKFCHTVNNEKFNLKPDSAPDISRYDFIKDVCRIEDFIKRNPDAIGYAIMITNQDVFWREMKPGQNSEQFFLHEGRILSKNNIMRWHNKAGEGTTHGRTKELKLVNDYSIHWLDYSSLGEGTGYKFKYLVLKIENH